MSPLVAHPQTAVSHESVLGPCNYLRTTGMAWTPICNFVRCQYYYTQCLLTVNNTDERCYFLIEQTNLVGWSHIRHYVVEWRHFR